MCENLSGAAAGFGLKILACSKEVNNNMGPFLPNTQGPSLAHLYNSWTGNFPFIYLFNCCNGVLGSEQSPQGSTSLEFLIVGDAFPSRPRPALPFSSGTSIGIRMSGS